MGKSGHITRARARALAFIGVTVAGTGIIALRAIEPSIASTVAPPAASVDTLRENLYVLQKFWNETRKEMKDAIWPIELSSQPIGISRT